MFIKNTQKINFVVTKWAYVTYISNLKKSSLTDLCLISRDWEKQYLKLSKWSFWRRVSKFTLLNYCKRHSVTHYVTQGIIATIRDNILLFFSIILFASIIQSICELRSSKIFPQASLCSSIFTLLSCIFFTWSLFIMSWQLITSSIFRWWQEKYTNLKNVPWFYLWQNPWCYGKEKKNRKLQLSGLFVWKERKS